MILPTKTTYVAHSTTLLSEKPTHLFKRDDIETNLELYQNWASICRQYRNGGYSAIIASNTSDNIDINKLWKTITQTVNCGPGGPVTVTTTVSVSPTSAPSNSGSISCQGQCWSDYLWRKYEKHIQ